MLRTIGGILLRMAIYGVLGIILSQVPHLISGFGLLRSEEELAAGFFLGAFIGFGHGVKRAWTSKTANSVESIVLKESAPTSTEIPPTPGYITFFGTCSLISAVLTMLIAAGTLASVAMKGFFIQADWILMVIFCSAAGVLKFSGVRKIWDRQRLGVALYASSEICILSAIFAMFGNDNRSVVLGGGAFVSGLFFIILYGLYVRGNQTPRQGT